MTGGNMNNKKLKKSTIVQTLVALFTGFGYFHYIMVHSDIQVLNPHIVFFMVMLMMFIVSLLVRRVLFVTMFISSATFFYILEFTSLMNQLEYLRLTLQGLL